MPDPTTFNLRIELLQKRIRRRNLEGALVLQPENRRYLSGYTASDHGIQESAGVLLIPATGKPYLLTDSRFELQAREEASGFHVELYSRGLVRFIGSLLPDLHIGSLGFESQYVLYSTFNKMKEELDKKAVKLVPLVDFVEKMRLIKSAEEIELLRSSVRLNEAVFQEVYSHLHPGLTEKEVAIEIELTMRRMGAERPSFDTIVAFGENGAKPHAVPGDRKLKSGDIVLIDMGLVREGYCSDMTRTFVIGDYDGTFVERHSLVRKAQLAGISAVQPGVTCKDVDLKARSVIKEGGYGSCFSHALGHGVGLAVHEEPRLSSRSDRKLKPGMVITVEPGIYIPEWGGIRLENMVVVTETGCENLNKDLTSLDII